jgi:hypothetical protein
LNINFDSIFRAITFVKPIAVPKSKQPLPIAVPKRMKIVWDIDEDTDKPAERFVTAHKKVKPITESSGNVSAAAGVKRAKIVYDLEERVKPKSTSQKSRGL